jgi:hypothetical protein
MSTTVLAQDGPDNNASVRIPHTIKPVMFDCSNENNAGWDKVPRISLSKESGTVVQVDAKKPLTLEFLRSNPSATVTLVPASIAGKLDSFNAQYGFQWDEKKLYGYVEVKEKDLDSRHPETSKKTFKHSPDVSAFDDLFHSTVIVEVGAPSWHRWITEMHAHVRPPNAQPLTSMFFGRTNDEEDFRELAGEAIACPTEGGWIAKFALAWLPFSDWRPKLGETASLRLIAPLPHSHDGYVLIKIAPFELTN